MGIGDRNTLLGSNPVTSRCTDRASPLAELLPNTSQIPDKIDMPGVIYDDLLEDVREGLEEIFDHPGSRAPFIPGYQDRADAIARAKLLREHGQKSSDIMMVHLRPPLCSHLS
ncbi:hypothetical protein FOXG_05663 [Fusarium oxysporum f. sp. lycopersici 4287]|uniref:Uncharacterized protein n=1 Tax=Fusarium oxysporum f. sp. lycopersici (strain 4287 / CBS 123668 / FGSC 9935 / NRRL 34936) TaxID=426428 RepID=A0A0J9UUZ3_FUSO4|nr:hypothetical protein FOXG_05663 [Fusarium oxysporum f. sp. lycopersici 4287]XP_018241106.1 hypothetical protein FOXG_05663 [Fusarium oxysporum f. sp. lycopersici 4287]XP_018241107.1 hypothetical protein FOXG_05663 [Fusarium oxysporum f. sp. lycopersici 4287]KNB03060.1 hypothetical protein FOXG_05663 [Fusarium oxysporum f. sp. lycopersici 4287]KNB03061.1 hypothetical protein FOXG_05663 [Fusarium oxysporum f. sp. lycopersici 4287]KNB03062.1 hypothetical protein FOXG_05663 [Fusarium oxysporum 